MPPRETVAITHSSEIRGVVGGLRGNGRQIIQQVVYTLRTVYENPRPTPSANLGLHADRKPRKP